MPTTFDVIFLGNVADMDTVEGNNIAENASDLVGLTFGGPGDPLVNHVVTLSPGTGGFTGGTANSYDQDNSPAENFRIDGGVDHIFDSAARMLVTINYVDGTSIANQDLAIFQDIDGNAFLAPDTAQTAAQGALEAGAIRSIEVTGVAANSTLGLWGNREAASFVTCFTPGIRIETPRGPTLVEDLQPGDLITTRDRGAQPVRWIARKPCRITKDLRPIRIRAGALGSNLPRADITVSPQHRMLIRSRVAKRLTGSAEVLIPARKLLGLPGVDLRRDLDTTTYLHLILDRHEIIFAEGAPTETLMTGPMALRATDPAVLREIEMLFPGLLQRTTRPARMIPSGKVAKRLVRQHFAARIPLLAGEDTTPGGP